MSLNQGFPNISAPFVDKTGSVSQPWLQFLINLWNRSGGNQSSGYISSLTASGTQGVVTTTTTNNGAVNLNVGLSTVPIANGGTGSNTLQNGFSNYIFYPTVPSLPNNLNFVTTQGTAIFNGANVKFQAINQTLSVSSIYDWWLNTDGTYTVNNASLSNYTLLPYYSTKMHIWRVQTDASKITSITFMTDTYPTVPRPNDRAATIDTWADYFYIYQTATAWSAGLSVTYGQLLKTTTGNVYQVITPGTTGGSAPTSLTSPFYDGTAQLNYYCQASYLGMIRRGQNNGIEYYFCNNAALSVMHKTLLTGSALGNPAGTTLLSMMLNYIKGVFFHIIGNRVNSGSYTQGQKMIAGGYIWLNQTAGTNAVAGVSPFSGTYTIGSSTVVDGGVTWLCIYQSYSSQQWFWLNVDATFLTFSAPDSHDSYMSTFASVLARYAQCGGSLSFMSGASPHPSGAGTFWTYAQIFGYGVNANLDTQISNFLTKTFQNDINPLDGSSFTTQYLEDNCESYAGYRDAAYVYGVLGDAVSQAAALANVPYIGSGIAGLYNTTYNLFAVYYGDTMSWATSTTNQWYPYWQCQFFPEFKNVLSIQDSQFKSVRYNVSVAWNSWWDDKGIDILPEMFLGVLAARNWQDNDKGYAFVEKFDRYFVTGGAITSQEMADYLLLKDVLRPSYVVLSANTNNAILLDQANNILSINGTMGIAATIATAKLTGGGANGSMTFVNGVLTAQTQAT